VTIEPVEHLGGDGLERAAAVSQPDPVRPPVVGITDTANKTGCLHEPYERGHRLLGESRSHRERTHPQPVLLEERQQHRAVRRPHVRIAAAPEGLVEELVPALRRLGEEIAEVVPVGAHI
jgi:hypothetical protein